MEPQHAQRLQGGVEPGETAETAAARETLEETGFACDGRPVLHGLTAAGATGVAHVLKILRSELEIAMALTGRPTLSSIDRSVIFG